MSVFKRPGADTYSYDFYVKGHRFSGALSTSNKREAESLESKIKAQARAEIAASAAFRADRMTWDIAASRYWQEVGQHHKNAGTTWKSLGWLTEAIGPKTPIETIGDNLVAELVARRRAEAKPSNRKSGLKKAPKLIGPATVNRTMTQVLRKVINRAAKVWKVKIGDITWRQHMLKEPKERVREATAYEEAAIMDGLDRGYDDAVSFAFASGCRRMEIVGLVWERVDFGNKQFTVVGKGNKARVIPMTRALFLILWRQQGNHPEAVFTYAAARVSKREGAERIRGARYPITDAGLRTAMRRAVDAAGVTAFRFHDTRHTMATRTLRASNMKVVQNLLGHERITTTEKYAHVMVEDVRAAMEAATPTKSPTDEDIDGTKTLKMVQKRD
ncbi:tyrosine-type recombinase/integrase [Devosia soli]|uniref:tyrosine-type recombinase/integrase n=1 Tax=Devosia soli TaxID=361041 RepID=UPI0006996D12|nr:site-specific integrase [Devosia soli]